jgi:hypothetical protein
MDGVSKTKKAHIPRCLERSRGRERITLCDDIVHTDTHVMALSMRRDLCALWQKDELIQGYQQRI